MKNEKNNLDRFKGENPFSVPEGYMEGLTTRIMSQLPDPSPRQAAKKISLMERVRPWLYMAAVFAGLGLFFRILVGLQPEKGNADSLLVKTEVPAGTISAIQPTADDEYLEFLQERYASYILAEEMGETE